VLRPRVELASGRCVGAGALLRWSHPGPGAVPAGGVHPHRRANLAGQAHHRVGPQRRDAPRSMWAFRPFAFRAQDALAPRAHRRPHRDGLAVRPNRGRITATRRR
jgi:hypothetical protein